MAQPLLLRLPILMAAAIAASAGAGDRSLSCPGADTMSETQAGTTVDTTGSGHSRLVIQTDPDGAIRIGQHGEEHAAIAIQSGTGGTLSIEQSGAGAAADIRQDGACNAAALSQSGSGNRAMVSQSGGNNRAVVRQGSSKE